MTQNDKEAKALQLFRKEIEHLRTDELYSLLDADHFLIRWLRARNLDVEKAKHMLQKYLEWRTTNPDFQIISDGTWSPPKMITDRIKVRVTGHDYEGRPIIWGQGGRWELGEIHDAGLKDELFRFIYSVMDNYVMPEIERRRKEKGVTQFIYVLDTSGVTLRKALHLQSAQTRIRFVREFEAYFPEILHSCYILNAHWVITNIYSILRPFISPHTQSKMNLFGSKADEWKLALRNKFPPEAIPGDYGGEGPSFSSIYAKEDPDSYD